MHILRTSCHRAPSVSAGRCKAFAPQRCNRTCQSIAGRQAERQAPRQCTPAVIDWACQTGAGRQVERQARSQCTTAVIEAPKESDGGSAVIDRPGVDLSQVPITQKTDAGFGAADTSQDKTTGGGNYRVMLLDSPKHTEKLVVQVLAAVVGSDELHAKNCFATSRKLGQAMVTSCLKEHAEFYVEQIKRQGVLVKMEPDTTTL